METAHFFMSLKLVRLTEPEFIPYRAQELDLGRLGQVVGHRLFEKVAYHR